MKFKDLTEATEFVLMIQDACNSRAIIRDFPDVMRAIKKFDPQQGTDAYNSHPLVVLMLDKLAQLAGGATAWSEPTFSQAYGWACSNAVKEG